MFNKVVLWYDYENVVNFGSPLIENLKKIVLNGKLETRFNFFHK